MRKFSKFLLLAVCLGALAAGAATVPLAQLDRFTGSNLVNYMDRLTPEELASETNKICNNGSTTLQRRWFMILDQYLNFIREEKPERAHQIYVAMKNNVPFATFKEFDDENKEGIKDYSIIYVTNSATNPQTSKVVDTEIDSSPLSAGARR